MINKINKLVRILFLLVFINSCKTAEFGFQSIDTNGMVYDFENRPLAGYEVRIGKYHAVSDITGRFLITKIPSGKYEIYGTKLGYESYTGTMTVGDIKQIVYIRVPSEKQLLDLVDTALTDNKIEEAETFLRRAKNTGVTNTEMQLFEAIVLFRKNDVKGAIKLLEDMKKSGINDKYVILFLDELKLKEQEK